MPMIDLTYSVWKSLAQAAGWQTFHQSVGTNREIVYAGSAEHQFHTTIGGDDYTDWVSSFPSAVSVSGEGEAMAKILESSLGSSIGEKRSSDGKPQISLWPTEGSRKTLVSHNWTDPTTWIAFATQVVEETPSSVTPLLIYELDNDNIIDTYHAKVWDEDAIGSTYRVLVEVSTDGGSNWTAKTEDDPHVGGPNEDYDFDYDNGIITFHSLLPVGAQVRVSYYYADLTDSNASHFVIAPVAGKTLKLRRAEVQFTKDVVINDTVVFETFGYVDVFAPQLLDTADPPGPYPSGTKIPIAATVYKGMRDYYNEANGAQPTYPALGGSGWRGLTEDVIVLQWDYAAVLPISYAAGMEVHIYLEHNSPFGGTYATATVYGLSESE